MHCPFRWCHKKSAYQPWSTYWDTMEKKISSYLVVRGFLFFETEFYGTYSFIPPPCPFNPFAWVTRLKVLISCWQKKESYEWAISFSLDQTIVLSYKIGKETSYCFWAHTVSIRETTGWGTKKVFPNVF